jgi:hypothetical protein
MTRTTFKTCRSRIFSSFSWISNIKDSRFHLSVRIQTRNMEEQTFSATLKARRKRQCITILDLESEEVETDLFFPTIYFSPFSLKTLRIKEGRELYIYMVHEVACTFGFPLHWRGIHYQPTALLLLFPTNSHHFHFLSFL